MKRWQGNPYGMTRARGWLSSLMLLAGCAALAGCSGDTPARNAPQAPSSGASSKIDPALSLTLHEPGSAGQDIDVLIRTRGGIDAARRAALESRGARIGSVIGDVVTARIPAAALPGIAGLDFVVRIELSRKQRLRQVP
jgi:hypothetical protein